MIRIGVIDSGIGGLSIVKGCIEHGAHGEYLYLYDNKYHPYGRRDKEELCAIAFLNIEALIKRGAEVIIFACNTLTGAAIDDMRKTFSLPIIGTEPAIKPASLECKKVVVLATPFTVASERIKSLSASVKDTKFSFPDCSGLATAIEYGYDNREFMRDKFSAILQRYSDTDGVVLGCTHYNFAKEYIIELLPNAKIYDSVMGVAKRLKSCFFSLLWECSNNLVRIITTQDCLDVLKQEKLNTYMNLEMQYE